MEDITKRIIKALRAAAQNARNADDAREAAELADTLDAEGAPIPGGTPVDPASIPEQPPVDNDHVAPGAEPFAHLSAEPEAK